MSSTEFCWRSTTTTPVTVEAMVLASRILDNSSLATDRAFATRIWKSCALDYFVAVQHYYQTVQQLDFNVDVTVCSPAFPHLVERLRLLEYLLHTRSPHQGALPFSVGGSLFAAGRNIALRGSVVVVDESGGVSNSECRSARH